MAKIIEMSVATPRRHQSPPEWLILRIGPTSMVVDLRNYRIKTPARVLEFVKRDAKFPAEPPEAMPDSERQK